MESRIRTKKLRIGGMTCANCQNKIQKKLRNTAGIEKAEVSYSAGTAVVTYDADIISLGDITAIIKKLDYKVLAEDERQAPGISRILGLLLIIAALYFMLEHFGILNLLAPSQLAETNMGYGMLFVIGLVTSIHCVAMCGGINLSQCIPQSENDGGGGRFSALRPAFLYNLGRVISYTAVGFVVGALGSAITFSNAAQGVLKLIAGVFMIIMGVNMLGIFPWLRKLNPRMPKFLARKIDVEKSRSKSALIVGLLNGFMPCGPLQAMQIYALSTGSAFAGAFSMLLFSLGTVPLMFGLGAISSAIGKKFTRKVMTVGAVLVVVLGLSMLTQGWSLSGFTGTAPVETPPDAADGPDIPTEDGVQLINSTLSSGRYPSITVQVGTPVKWVIDAPKGSINGCNNRAIIDEYDIEYTFKTGENVIEFTPTETGSFKYNCWMGMIRGTINVVEAGEPGGPGGPGEAIETPPEITEPVPANVAIPTDRVAVAELVSEDGFEYQTVTIELTDDGFSPAVVVMQAGLDTEWIIQNTSSPGANNTLLMPLYGAELDLQSGENPLPLYPTESFEFSNGDNKFYGYVKVVDDLGSIDIEAIQAEAAGFQTMIYPPDTFGAVSGCCG
jgi:sulfite exporter TauE/SafE/copper chaperone CopZ/plastocyanin domain-containing protein